MKKTIKEVIKSKIKQGTIKKASLLKYLKGLGYQISERGMRQHIHELITIHGVMIESSNFGYTIIKSISQLKRAIDYRTKKVEGEQYVLSQMEKKMIVYTKRGVI